ncbi:MAG: putative Ig domain-containing protein, partial [Vicinamibacterales bacterium]
MKNRCRSPRGLRLAVGFGVAVGLSLTLALVRVAAQQLPAPIPGRNVNMVSGTTLPGGDPFLQRQNEPSIAVSTRNPLHLLGAANDYRTVDIPGLGDEVTGDAWLGIFKSFDGGGTWKSTLLPGFRQDVSQDGIHSPLYGLEAAADPVIRAGTHGLFYMGGMAFNRDKDDGKVFVARYIDNNNLEAGDSIAYLGTTVIDTGSETRFLDKPWIAVDIPRAMHGNGKEDKNDHGKDEKDKGKDKKGKVNDKDDRDKKPSMGPVCQIPGQAQPIPAGTIYVMYSAFFDTATGTAAPPATTEQDQDRDRDFGHRKRRERENGEDHTPGKPLEGRTLIMLARSTDCGRTFSNPKKISERNQINQGSVAAIDSATGTIYVAWREFMSALQPDAILITKSTDGGDTFSTPVKIATIHPFDQGSSATSFRTNAYPTMTVDGSGRVYVAWSERGIGPLVNGQGGDARIVISSSTDGKTWSAPDAADNPQQRGHQFMPVLSFGGGKLHLVWWDQRDDKSKQWGTYIDEAPILNWVGAPALRPSRHTIDLRGAAGLPGAPPAFGPSAKLSNYLEGVRPGKTTSEQLQFNAPNLPLFALGTMPFIGDYLDVTASPSFIANGDGTWRFNTLVSDPATYFTSWSDNRDVRKPAQKINGKEDWVHYTPPTFAGWTGTSIYDPTQPVQQCAPGMAGMRDQNIYSARVLTGLVMTTLGNTKPLGYATTINGTQQLIQRSFVVTVTNPDPPVRLPDGTITGFKDVVLHINAQPVGGRASFLQFEPLIDLPVRIAPKSSVSREVFVTSTDRNASVPITVTEGNSTATSAKVILNPDITNPDIENPDIENPGIINPDIENAEAHAITVSTPDITNPDIENLPKANPDIENPDIENPDIENPDIENPDITNPDIINPDIENPDIENPDIENPDIENPDIENPDIENAALTDVTWNVANVGNTATSYQVKLLLKQAQQQRLMNSGVKFQLVVTKTTASPVLAKDLCGVAMPNRNLTVVTINSPAFVDPSNSQEFSTVVNPDIENPDIENATVALAPGDTARVTLRVYSPVGDTTTDPTGTPSETPLQDLTGALTDLKNLGVVTTSHPVDTIAVQQGSTTPVVEASIPVIVTTTLPDAARTLAYTATIAQTGSTAPFSFSVTTGALPPGLTFHADGTIDGAPTASGVYTFTVRLVDANAQYATATLIIRVFEPLVVSTGALPGGVVNQAYSTALSASGGFPPFTWSLAGGTLPSGVTLSTAGVLSGTPTQSGTFAFTAQAMDMAAPPRTSIGAFVLNVTPAANAQSVNVVEDTATTITVSGTGAAPAAFTFAIGNQPAHGTVTGSGPAFTYAPASNYNGPDSFTFSVT